MTYFNPLTKSLVLKGVFLGDQKGNHQVHNDSENDKVQKF